MNLNQNYYDYPEGEDAFGKMVATNKYAAALGLAWATMDVLAISKPQGYLPTLGRYAVVTAPFIAVASAFTMGTFLATSIRKKDDRLNYVIGGYTAGAALAACKKSAPTFLVAGTAFAIAGAVKKLSKIEGWEFFPYYPMGSGGARSHDYTLMAERPKNWTKE